jgi:hypothetical protein
LFSEGVELAGSGVGAMPLPLDDGETTVVVPVTVEETGAPDEQEVQPEETVVPDPTALPQGLQTLETGVQTVEQVGA